MSGAGRLPADVITRLRVVRCDGDSWLVDARIEVH